MTFVQNEENDVAFYLKLLIPRHLR